MGVKLSQTKAERNAEINKAIEHSETTHAPADAEKNVIVGIQKNGVDVSVDSNRKANITVPTNLSELTNDKGFITASDNVATATTANHLEHCYARVNNTNIYPYHRILSTGVQTGSFVDISGVYEITAGFNNGGYGIFKVDLRTNNVDNGALSQGSIKWIVRYGFDEDQLVVGLNKTSGSSYLDVYYKCKSAYLSVNVNRLFEGYRGVVSKRFTMINSSQPVNSGTPTEAYASITTSTTSPRTYTDIITATDQGNVRYAKLAGSADATKRMQTFLKGSTTNTYGDRFQLYAQWETDKILKLKCDNYTVKADQAIQDSDGNVIKDTYVQKTDITEYTADDIQAMWDKVFNS